MENPLPTEQEKRILRWFSQEEEAPPHEKEVENLWREQKGVNPETNEMWLTPRMKRNAIRTAATFDLEENGVREMIQAKENQA